MLNTLELLKLPNKLNLKGSGVSWKQNTGSGNNLQNAILHFMSLLTVPIAKNCVKYLRVTEIVKQIKFEGIWGELRAKSCFRRQAPTKYLRKTQVFM